MIRLSQNINHIILAKLFVFASEQVHQRFFFNTTLLMYVDAIIILNFVLRLYDKIKTGGNISLRSKKYLLQISPLIK